MPALLNNLFGSEFEYESEIRRKWKEMLKADENQHCPGSTIQRWARSSSTTSTRPNIEKSDGNEWNQCKKGEIERCNGITMEGGAVGNPNDRKWLVGLYERDWWWWRSKRERERERETRHHLFRLPNWGPSFPVCRETAPAPSDGADIGDAARGVLYRESLGVSLRATKQRGPVAAINTQPRTKKRRKKMRQKNGRRVSDGFLFSEKSIDSSRR